MKNGKELLIFEGLMYGVGIAYPNGEIVYFIPSEYRTLLELKGIPHRDYSDLIWSLKNLIKDSTDIDDLKRKLENFKI